MQSPTSPLIPPAEVQRELSLEPAPNLPAQSEHDHDASTPVYLTSSTGKLYIKRPMLDRTSRAIARYMDQAGVPQEAIAKEIQCTGLTASKAIKNAYKVADDLNEDEGHITEEIRERTMQLLHDVASSTKTRSNYSGRGRPRKNKTPSQPRYSFIPIQDSPQNHLQAPMSGLHSIGVNHHIPSLSQYLAQSSSRRIALDTLPPRSATLPSISPEIHSGAFVTPPEQQNERQSSHQTEQQNTNSHQVDQENEPMSVDTDATVSVGKQGLSRKTSIRAHTETPLVLSSEIDNEMESDNESTEQPYDGAPAINLNSALQKNFIRPLLNRLGMTDALIRALKQEGLQEVHEFLLVTEQRRLINTSESVLLYMFIAKYV